MVKLYEFVDKEKFLKLFADLVTKIEKATETIGIFTDIMEKLSNDELIEFLGLKMDRHFYESLVIVNKKFSSFYASLFGKWKEFKEE